VRPFSYHLKGTNMCTTCVCLCGQEVSASKKHLPWCAVVAHADPTQPILSCKDCHEGKHGACNGETFDEEHDDWVPCHCAVLSHE
jgi:hypothetical protein